MRLIEYYHAIQVLSRSVEPSRTSSDFKFYSYDVITQGQGRNRKKRLRYAIRIRPQYMPAKFHRNPLTNNGDESILMNCPPQQQQQQQQQQDDQGFDRDRVSVKKDY